MRIRISKFAPRYSYALPANRQYADMVRKLRGRYITVDTRFMFNDQFNTVPIPGVCEEGLRIHECDVDMVIGDERIGRSFCSLCYGNSPTGTLFCLRCGKAGSLTPYKVNRQVRVVRKGDGT